MFEDRDKKAIETKILTPGEVTVRQAIYAVANWIAPPGEPPESYVEHAQRVLLEFDKLGAIGKQNLYAWKPGSTMSWSEIQRIFGEVNISYVYLMKNSHGHIKVGKSNDPNVRLKNIATGASGGADLLEQVKCPAGKVRSVEAQAHHNLAQYRIEGGEWFDCSQQAARDAVAAAFRTVYGREIEE